MSHTPGPWEIITKNGAVQWEYSVVGERQLVFSTTVPNGGMHHANANLIAAAPDLLAACENVMFFIRECDEDDDAASRDVLEQLDLAIRKATE